MNKLLTICLLIATAFSAKAQEMNFEETVKYINDKIDCCSQYKTDTITATQDGTIIWGPEKYRTRVNLLDLYPENISGAHTIESSLGIMRFSTFSKIAFALSSNKKEDFNVFEVEAEQKRVYNALIHLRSLCSKTKDPFDK
jgi:hypothetical protein